MSGIYFPHFAPDFIEVSIKLSCEGFRGLCNLLSPCNSEIFLYRFKKIVHQKTKVKIFQHGKQEADDLTFNTYNNIMASLLKNYKGSISLLITCSIRYLIPTVIFQLSLIS